jgi:hypothetical protein
MEQLPIDVMTQILFFLDIPARIKLSQTSKSMEFLVNFHCSQVWEHIKFHQVNSTVGNRLTDFELSKLLERVQARKVTKAIHLTWSEKIQGVGISGTFKFSSTTSRRPRIHSRRHESYTSSLDST